MGETGRAVGRGRMVVGAFFSAVLLAACGGGLDDSGLSGSEAVPNTVSTGGAGNNGGEAPAADLSVRAAADAVDSPSTAESLADAASGGGEPEMVIQAVFRLPIRRLVTAPLTPDGLPTSSVSLLNDIQRSATCQAAYVAPASLDKLSPVPLAAPVTLSAADLSAARAQFVAGPFLAADDFVKGSPDELARLRRNAEAFRVNGEAMLTAENAAQLRSTHGSLARDAAFVYLLQPNAQLLASVRSYLLSQASASVNNLAANLCLREADGGVRDAWFAEASWVARFAGAYDAVRTSLPAAERLRVENFIRRNAYFLAAQLDYGFNYIFPQRAVGNYEVRGASAAAKVESEQYLSQRFDTNGDCRIDARDDAREYPVRAYARADGSSGPRLSVLSQWYNNRKSMNAVAIGLIGTILDDSELQLRAKRYFREWLTYSVYPDGSEGEYSRNGDYCVANQGLVYANANVQGAVLLADILARKGDRDLLNFSTRDGLFGSASNGAEPAKSIAMVIGGQLDLARGLLPWYQHQGHLTKQVVAPTAHLGRMDTQVFGVGGMTDSYHQLGLLLGAKNFPQLPIAGVVLRDVSVTDLPWPGASGNAVATGFGSWAGAWTDMFNIYPSAFLLRAR